MSEYYGVYRVLKSGKLKYVSRSATASKKLAEEIARDLSRGEIVMPDGRTKTVRAYPHVARPLGDESAATKKNPRGKAEFMRVVISDSTQFAEGGMVGRVVKRQNDLDGETITLDFGDKIKRFRAHHLEPAKKLRTKKNPRAKKTKKRACVTRTARAPRKAVLKVNPKGFHNIESTPKKSAHGVKYYVGYGGGTVWHISRNAPHLAWFARDVQSSRLPTIKGDTLAQISERLAALGDAKKNPREDLYVVKGVQKTCDGYVSYYLTGERFLSGYKNADRFTLAEGDKKMRAILYKLPREIDRITLQKVRG